ncbi:glycoside hydrolase family 9 protein [Sinomicrobium weinanense]|uniref:Glycoside hydrolase family 9 protein n=1 Tax=Sinomicrobium weinanense TaxID=2842200 RepID=A0A926JR32_9FLAO|nr:glycoside hydrolase family 9 protein [Sinomicrobium weinanense]MBC9795945.1 glycoside hydrolase family 9 protein [Sinomicrobium weinanense]MBU3122064.1 glycoside hydrolase family 9 protein [Sinomicrobium weinanense]
MKKVFPVIVLLFILCSGCSEKENKSWIRINQLGYLPHTVKAAVLGSKDETLELHSFSLHDAKTGEPVYESDKVEAKGKYGPFKTSFRLDFSEFETEGEYYIEAGNARSPEFRIAPEVYDHTADFLLRYMRQQRCGFNPYLRDSCHTDDGYIIYHPEKENGQRIDVTGGWHDATDYLQYTATSANAVFQLLFSYRENPEAFGDAHNEDGSPGSNGIPDIIDEARYGMDWLLKMNPSPDEYYNQIADDRDHAGFRLPNHDSVVYDKRFRGRPVYLASGKPQGLFEHKNRSTGVASTAGKFASSFALGAGVLKEFYPDYADTLLRHARDAYAYGKKHPGVSQTAPGTQPYFYEEDNWKDDMELAAATLYKLTGNDTYKEDGLNYAAAEKITPWIGRDTVRHYQFYPFLNAGHYELAGSVLPEEKKTVALYYAEGLERLYQRGKDGPFLIGTPFVWCSNNLVTAAWSQAILYRKLTGDTRYETMEAALRDWLFGCNPWGTSMVVGLPDEGDTPFYPHSSLTHLYGYMTDGGLVDGPVYGSIFNSLKGLQLTREDPYADFQSDAIVYHDDVGDYSTNEPTMDGTACLIYGLSSMQAEGNGDRKATTGSHDPTGALIRGNRKQKKIALIFSGHEYADGGHTISETLKKHQIKASFFFTGDFYRNKDHSSLIEQLAANGHYLGPHSDQHLLYNDWSGEKKLLVNKEEFTADIQQNYAEMSRFGISKTQAPYFLPPYEWNDSTITQWSGELGLTLINYTPGTISHADYTRPDDKNYKDSKAIYTSITEYENTRGLNGFFLLTHIGSSPERTDKFYTKLDSLIGELEKKGYEFVLIKDLIDQTSAHDKDLRLTDTM